MHPLLTKNNKNIPPIGLGTFPLQGENMTDIVYEAIKMGYRLIDTADDYRGESGIGLGCKRLYQEGIVEREDLFIQTKISSNGSYNDEPLAGIFFNDKSSFMRRHSVGDIVRYKVETSLRELRTDYIDSLLIHVPLVGYNESIWKVMIDLQKEGLVRYIGVSNFHQREIEKMASANEWIYPSINEIYISPIGTKQEQLDYSDKNNIQLMTYSPLMDVTAKRLTENMFKPYIEKYKKSLAQIVLRWNIDRGCIPLPKTSNTNRLKENFDIVNFSLSKEEVDEISKMNRDFQYLPESKIAPGF